MLTGTVLFVGLFLCRGPPGILQSEILVKQKKGRPATSPAETKSCVRIGHVDFRYGKFPKIEGKIAKSEAFQAKSRKFKSLAQCVGALHGIMSAPTAANKRVLKEMNEHSVSAEKLFLRFAQVKTPPQFHDNTSFGLR